MAENHHDDDKTQTHIPILKDTVVGRYRIIEKIGAGGMGEVYLAQDTELDRKAALKFLPQHLCRDDDCRARFKREAQAAAKLSHPNIIHVYEVSEYKGRPFFAMEHVEGQSLKDYSAENELSIEQILELGIQICEGLQAAHDKGITHRDIKPSNILIDSHGRAQIVDFGLALVVGTDQLTKTGSTLGTIGYMSPEQVRGREVDHRSDVFSLGVVLYELITKQNPFKRDSEAATLKAVSDDPPEPLARFKSGLPDGLQAIIDKALEKDVKTRYQHADGMQADLMRVKRSVESGQLMATGKATKGSTVRFWWIAAALVIVIAAIFLIMAKPWQTETTSDEPRKIMLAVLPFDNLGNPEDEYFADGMAEEIIGKLARLSELGVISRTSSMQYKAAQKSIRQIGEELGVDYILEGTVRWVRSGDESHIRVQPQLIRVKDDVHIWADSYDGVFADVLGLQTRIALSVADALDLSLLEAERVKLSKVDDVNPEAYDLYLKGGDYETYELDQSLEAIESLQRSIEIDPDFVPALARLASAMAHHFKNFGQAYIGSIEQAQSLAERAIELDSTDADGYTALARYVLWVDNDPGRALFYLQQASSLEPDNAEVLGFLGMVMFWQGEFQTSLQFFEKARKFDPARPNTMHAEVLNWLRRWDDEIVYCDWALQLDPDSSVWQLKRAEAIGRKTLSLDSLNAALPQGYDTLINKRWESLVIFTAHMDNRDFQKASQAAHARLKTCQTISDSGEAYMGIALVHYLMRDERCSIYADSSIQATESFLAKDSLSVFATGFSIAYLAFAHAMKGDSAIADSLCAQVLQQFPVEDKKSLATMPRCCAYAYIIIGDEERAIDIFEALMSRPSVLSLFELMYDPGCDPLRDHPRFQALIKKYRTDYGT